MEIRSNLNDRAIHKATCPTVPVVEPERQEMGSSGDGAWGRLGLGCAVPIEPVASAENRLRSTSNPKGNPGDPENLQRNFGEACSQGRNVGASLSEPAAFPEQT